MDWMFMMQKYIYLQQKKTVLSKQDYLKLFFLFFPKPYRRKNQSNYFLVKRTTLYTAFTMNRFLKKSYIETQSKLLHSTPYLRTIRHTPPFGIKTNSTC